jgi:glycine dehydrogenase subunit 1
MKKSFIHPYNPNSVPQVKESMLREIGVDNVERLFEDVPERIRLSRELSLPKSSSEYKVRKTISSILHRNKTIHDMPVFLGAGCWPHYVPAVVDEINGRAEFVTAYAGDTYCDLGKFQTIFEFQSMIGELVGLDVVGWPMYDWASSLGEASRMVSRITDRHEILVPRTISPDRLSVLKNYCSASMAINMIDYDRSTGQIDLHDLKRKISSRTAGVYIENPSYLGFIETQGEEISKLAHNQGAVSVVGVEPLSLGILTCPSEYGADIVIGDIQPLGNHMNYGGGLAGFIACKDEERFIGEMPLMLLSITRTEREGEKGFLWWTLPQRLHFFTREKGKSFAGTTAGLLAISSAVYMALLGPQGLRELAEAIMKKSHYAMKLISEIDGLKTPFFDSPHFEEFTINFDGTSKSVFDINRYLLSNGIQGGKDLIREFPELGNTALYCVTEIHTKEEIETLVTALREAIR